MIFTSVNWEEDPIRYKVYMNKISGVIIAKNEEDMIGGCIESLAFCHELILVDNGSTDHTVAISKKLGARIISSNDKDFSAMRNLGLKYVTTEWILYVDADERVSKQLEKKIKEIIDSNSYFQAYKIKRKNFYLGGYEWPYTEKLERLFLRKSLIGWRGALHESPIVSGSTGETDGFLLHFTHRNLSSMVEKTIEWSKIEADLRFVSSHPKMTWWRFPRVMMFAFWDSYVRQKGLRVGVVGLIESLYQAFSIFITYARLWELQNQIKSKNEN